VYMYLEGTFYMNVYTCTHTSHTYYVYVMFTTEYFIILFVSVRSSLHVRTG